LFVFRDVRRSRYQAKWACLPKPSGMMCQTMNESGFSERPDTSQVQKGLDPCLPADRFIKTLQEEWAYAVPFQSSFERNNWLPKWLDIYNCQRQHGGIGFKTPISRLTQHLNNVSGNHT
jgi:Integrase core domain